MIFGEMVAAARKAKGASQGDLACAVGVSRPTIASIECGFSRPGFDVFLRIVKTLDIDISPLLAATVAGNLKNGRREQLELRMQRIKAQLDHLAEREEEP